MSDDFTWDVSLSELDPFADLLVSFEEERQARKIILIASESIAPRPVREALASVFTNVYAEGYPAVKMCRSEEKLLRDFNEQIVYERRYGDRRYYKGCEYADFVESLAQRRAAEVFATESVRPEDIFVNVQPLSGAAANNAVYEGFVKPGETVMGMALSHGGHLTHGSEANRSGKRYRIVPYEVDPRTGRLDYDQIKRLALECQPRMIIAGYSAYPWSIDWAKFAEIRDAVPGCILMGDIAHPAGLIAAGLFPSPVGYADVITFTTHKTLCGPRGACILTTDPEKAHRVNVAVFPGEQGGPHINQIAAKAVCFAIAGTPRFKELQRRIVENAQAMCDTFRELGARIAYGGTDSHMFLLDLSCVNTGTGYPLRGEIASRILDACGITLNKNTIAGEKNPLDPAAIRLGTTWVTQRGMGVQEMKKIAELIWRVLTNIKTVAYHGARTEAVRGKIDHRVMEEVQSSVAKLTEGRPPRPRAVVSLRGEPVERSPLATVHAKATGHSSPPHYGNFAAELESARTKAALFDLSETPQMLVRGERAQIFLQEALTADIFSLENSQSSPALLLGPDGETIDLVLVHRIDPKRYLVFSAGLSGADTPRWLAYLSDGYVVFDRSDPFRKIDGPVAVEDIRGSGKVALLLTGNEAPALVRPPLTEKVQAYQASLPLPSGATAPIVFLLLRSEDAVQVWNELARTATASGTAVRHALMGEALKCKDKLLSPSKPYFVGQRTSGPKPAKKEFRFEELPSGTQKTVLYEEHLRTAGPGRMTTFAGWSLPLYYVSIGHEHSATRRTAALFDVSHMGILEVSGQGAPRFLDLVTSNFVYGLKVGQAHYTYLLDPDGIPIDDMIVYRIEPERYILVVNAVNAKKVEAWLRAVASREVLIDRDNPALAVDATARILDLKSPASGEHQLVDMALQGPRSRRILEQLCTPPDVKCLRQLGKFRLGKFLLDGVPAIVSRTGYTGEEHGYEIFVHPDAALKIWRRILEVGRPFGVAPAGLGARDAARMEAGLPLHGHEIAGPHKIFPVEAGYGQFVKLHKPYFIGRTASVQKNLRREMTVVRFQLRERNVRAIRHNDPVVSLNGECIGYVTSAAQVSGFQLGMAYILSGCAVEGERIGVLPLPRSAAATEAPLKGPASIRVGDKVPLYLEATILPRFLSFKKVRQRLLEQVT